MQGLKLRIATRQPSPGSTVPVTAGVEVRVFVGPVVEVRVGVLVNTTGVLVRVLVGAVVGELVAVLVRVEVLVATEVLVGVLVITGVLVPVLVRVGVLVGGTAVLVR